MNLSLTMLNAIARNRRTLLTLAVSALFVVALSTMVLRGASASAFDKLGITEQSRVGQIIKRIAPNAKLASVKEFSPQTPQAPAKKSAPAAPAAPAVTRTVTNGNDSGSGSLRDTISIAGAGDTIVFSGVTTVTLTSAELLIDKNLTINGGTNGVTVTRSSATQFRIFHIDVGVTASMSKLTITGGNPGSNQAGGVQNSGTLTMTDCAITGNTSIQGSGIQNDNSLTMTNCTISGNTSTGSPGTGGGLVSFGTTNNLTNCTISGNTASNDGGGIYIGGGTLSLTNCTVTNNNSGGSGDGMFLVGSGHVFKNSIVAANPGFNIVILSGGSISSTSANNLIGNTGTGGISNGVNGNIVTASSPLLGALASNGGYVQTHALLPGSLAINAGTNTGAPSTDPRGIARPQQSTVDIGAYESRGFTMALSSGNNQSTQINTNFPNPLIVTVVSASSEPVDGGRVTFTGPNTGAGLSIVSTSVSIASGAATTGTISANGTGGSYTVSATAGGVSTGVNFSLTNTCTNPSISIPPANQTVCAGSTASFSVTATGTALTYQWQKNSTNISGATSSSYTTPVTTLADSGAVYTVIVSGACGTPVTSSNATLTVNGATITTQPVSQVICDGDSATLSVTATGTNLSYQWRKGGSPIGGATSSSYTIPAFGAANADSYDVVVTSTGCASVTSSAANLSLLGVTTMTNLMPLWGGRLNGTLFEVGTNGAPSTEGPGYAFDGTFSKSLIRYTANAGYVITPASCDPAGKIINQFRIYTANDFSDRDPASYAFYGTNATISGNGPFDATQFTLISSGSLALPSGRNTSTLDDANSQLVSFANATTYKSFMLIFPTVKNAGAVLSTQIGEVKFYPENYQPTLNTTAASMTQGQSSTGALIGAATSGTSQAANTLTVEVSSDGTNFSSTATLNGVTISNVAVAANGNVTANLMATCAATNANFTVRITNDQSQSVTATLTVNVTAATPPTTAAAGSDQLLCATAPATLAANTPSVGTGAWSIVSGPSLLTSQLTSLTSPTPIFTPAGGVGTYTLRWTITGVCATSTDDVVLTYTANPTVANAGPDQTICATSVTLAGNLSTVGTGAWSIISGAGGTITTPSSPTSGFTGVAGTTYTLRWTISNSPCAASTDDVVITLTANPTAANAGPDQTVCATSATLAANTPTVGTGAWSIVSGAGGTVTTPSSPTSGFTGVAGTTYTLRWTISNSPCTASTDDVVITLTANPTAANAGPDQTLCATSVTLAANAPIIGTGAWSIISGAGGTVTTPSSPTSGFTGVAGTTYTLRWTISNSPCTASTDDMVITLRANPTVANAGSDQTVCATSATLAANTPTVGTGAWSIISGAGGNVTTPSSPTSGFTGVAGTTYTLRWTISNSPCTASTDDVVITLTANPTAANAGPDQTVCVTSATLAANTPTVGTGAWSIVSGAGGTVTTPSSPTSGFTGTAGTTYTLRWTISNSPCTASTDDVVITLTANPTAANAGSDQSFCGTSAATLAANTPAAGTGAWTVVTGPSTSTTQFSNVSSPTATFTPAGGTGTYTLRWTISNSPCVSSTDDVVLTYNAVPGITLGASPSVLPGATTANLPYSATTGSPNQYSIDYNTAANTAGFADVTNASLTASPIVLTVPNGAASGTYNATLTVRNSTTGCVSSSTAFTVTISNCPTAFTVNNTGDGADATPGNGVCETATGNGICTLRAAIQEANALTACSPMTITITATGTITLGSMLPGIARSNLTISGPGADQLTVSGNNAVTVLQINASAANVTISDLTIANGRIVNSTGAGLQNFSNGAVTLNNLGFTGNQTITGGDGAALNHNGTGTLNVTGSTFSGNASASVGGALAVSDTGTVNLTNCTFTGNTAVTGGGVYNNVGNLTLLNCTLSGNTATGSAGGLGRAGGTVSLKNTLVAGNTAPINPDVAGTFTSQGNNLIGNPTGSTGFGGSDLLNVGALLGALGNYGGTTNTIPLLPGSPAINAGTATGAPASDQRGIARVGNVDIGAFESRGFTLAIAGGNNQSTITNSAFALPLSVSVTSANSEPVNGGRVSFAPPGSGASCALATNPATITSGAATSAATANAILGGPYIVSAAAAGATSVNFSLTNTNSAPTITAGAALSRQQGSAGTSATIATVNDGETPIGSLVVTATTVPAGITVTGITNTAGTITATVAASCAATLGNNTVVLTVTDGNSGTATANLTVTVTANSAPTLSYAAASVNAGSATTNSPTTATDNGSISSYAVQSQGTYTGTISVNASGVVSISNAVPPGVHTITIRATDNCGATTDATFSLTVTNTPPTIAAQSGVTRQQGAGSSNSQIATVGDAESGVNGVTVKVNNASSATVNGVTVSNISNSGGTVTADIVATCGASNASFTLTATDGHAATATATLNVTVTGITLSTLVNGLTFVSYSQTLTAAGGTGSYTFSLVAGTLPPGLTLSGNVLSGTPTTAGASTFTIRASDTSNTCFGERAYTINIGSTGLMYYPLARPVRLLDTRPGASPNACFQPNAPITGGTTRTQPARGTCEGLTIPANATTITGHITTVQSGGGSLTLYPSDAPQPNVTNSNYLANEILNNAFTVGLGVNDGAFKLFVGTNTDVVIDVTGYYAPPASGGLYFHPLPKPIRLLETRAGLTGCQTPGAQLQTGTTRTQTGVLTCDGVTIPTDALALVGNATTTNSAGNGYLTLYPANATQPFASSSNFAAGVNRNAPFTVGLSPSGEFNIYTARTTDLVIDVMGYYSAQASDTNGQGLLFNSLGAPLRLLDTRAGQSACYNPGAAMTGQTVYTQDTQIPCTNLTSVARGLVGNVSALNATANGFVTFWPSNATQPTVATSNYQTGRVFNRHFTVGLGPDVAFKRYVLSTTDLIIDISGFFAP